MAGVWRAAGESGERRATLLAAAAVSLSALLFAGTAQGLDPSNTLTQYGHTAWRVRDGTFASQPSSIAQTTDGFLWIGMDTGLLRFDGVRFAPWKPPSGSPLPDDRIVNILGTRDGSLWIGTVKGLARWHDGHLTVYARAGRFGALVEDRQGTVWAGHTRVLTEVPPLCRFRNGEFRCFGFADEDRLRYVGALHEDRQGNLWLGGEAGVCRWQPDRPVCFEIPPARKSDDRAGVFFLADDAEGNLWAATAGVGLWRLAAGRWLPYPKEPDSPSEFGPVLVDGRGSLWIGTRSRGLLRQTGGRTDVFSRADGLSDDSINELFEDREGNVWVATPSGLDRFRDVKVATLTPREGLPGSYFGAVAASRDGGVWIAESRALYHLGEAGLSTYSSGHGLPGENTSSLLEDSRGRLWAGVDDGLAYREPGEHGRFLLLRMPDGSLMGLVRSVVEDRDGDLWVATTQSSHALVRVRDRKVVEVLPGERFGRPQIGAMAAEPRGGVWVATVDSELAMYREGRLELHGHLGPGRIHSLLPEVRGLWLATTHGLGLFRNGKLRNLDSRQGLPCDDIEDALRGQDGSLWLKTACGLVQIVPQELDAWSETGQARVQVRTLGAFEGAQAAASPFAPRSTRSLDGRLWFAIEGSGLQVLDPRHLQDNAVVPPVRIVRVVADRKSYEPGPRLRLPPLTRDLEIDFTALSLAIPEKVRFRYQLAGAGQEWHDTGTHREAFFTNLEPGSYRFRVVACNNDGLWNQQGAVLDFVLLPAFHQTRPFQGMSLAGLALLGWSAYRWRLRQVASRLGLHFQERLNERTRIARELHDTLLQGYLSASMQLHVVCDELPPDLPQKPRLYRVLQLMAEVNREGRNALRGLRISAPQPAATAETAHLDELAQALSKIPQELGLTSAASLRVVVEGQPRPLRPPIRDEAYRIAREALVNACRHAAAAAIEVEIEFTSKALRIVVRDDGRGIDPEVLRAGREGHWGLTGMQERANAIGARLKVWSRERAGTEVELSLPGELAYLDEPAAGRLQGWRRWVPGSRRKS